MAADAGALSRGERESGAGKNTMGMLEAVLSGGVTFQFLVFKGRNDGVRNYKKQVHLFHNQPIYYRSASYPVIQHHDALRALRRAPLLTLRRPL